MVLGAFHQLIMRTPQPLVASRTESQEIELLADNFRGFSDGVDLSAMFPAA